MIDKKKSFTCIYSINIALLVCLLQIWCILVEQFFLQFLYRQTFCKTKFFGLREQKKLFHNNLKIGIKKNSIIHSLYYGILCQNEKLGQPAIRFTPHSSSSPFPSMCFTLSGRKGFVALTLPVDQQSRSFHTNSVLFSTHFQRKVIQPPLKTVNGFNIPIIFRPRSFQQYCLRQGLFVLLFCIEQVSLYHFRLISNFNRFSFNSFNMNFLSLTKNIINLKKL